jgi:hypothetical protein
LTLLKRFAEVNKERLAELTKQKHARRKAKGKATNQYVGYGFKLVGVAGRRRVVEDKEDRHVMRHIVKWRQEGDPWERIYFHLRKLKVKTSRNKEWSCLRIRRAYVAELRLQANEEARKVGMKPAQA